MHLPFRNFRALLSLHAKTTPGRVFIIEYRAGERAQQLYWEFNARVHQTAGLLRDELGIGRGDRVGVLARSDSRTLIACAACWLMGAVVVPFSAADDSDDTRRGLIDAGARALFTPADWANRALPLDVPTLRAIIETDPTPHYPVFLHLDRATAQRPDSFFDDDPPDLDDAALHLPGEQGETLLTQRDLLLNAARLAAAQAFTGGQRSLSLHGLDSTVGIVTTLLTPLSVGASLVLDASPDALAQVWRRLAAEKIHIAYLPPAALEGVSEAGWGEGVGRHDLLHFRHFASIDEAGSPPALIEQFEEAFSLPVLPGYGTDAAGVVSLLPFEWSWADHRRWVRQPDTCLGCPLPGGEQAVDLPGYGVADAQGRQVFYRKH
jgi:fatty-acyl-CoA synthase